MKQKGSLLREIKESIRWVKKKKREDIYKENMFCEGFVCVCVIIIF